MSATAAVIVVALLVALVTLTAAWAYNTAQRLDRLHIRLDRSRDALQAALDRRCAVVAALYPELAPLARETEEVRLSPTDLDTRLAAERRLEAALQDTLHDTLHDHKAAAPTQLEDAHTRVHLAQRFYNDAVADTLALRLRPSVRALRLGGTAALPEFAGESRRAVADNRR